MRNDVAVLRTNTLLRNTTFRERYKNTEPPSRPTLLGPKVTWSKAALLSIW